MARHLLIISCSGSKERRAGLMPAIQRYTGAWYGVINKLNREGKFPGNLDILIISAKYGLICSDEPIADYDRRMDSSRAKELNNSIIGNLKKTLENAEYESILINMGKDYMEAIRRIEEVVPDSVKISMLSGTIGPRKRDLKEWILSIRQT